MASPDVSKEYSDSDNLLEESLAILGSHEDTHASDDIYYKVLGGRSGNADDELIYETELDLAFLEDITVHFEGVGYYKGYEKNPLYIAELTLYLWDYEGFSWYTLGTIEADSSSDHVIDWTYSSDSGVAPITDYMNESGQMKLRWYTKKGPSGLIAEERCDEAYISIVYSQPQNPVASFTFSPETPLVNEPVTFDASLSTPDGGTIVSYAWDFGDGTQITEENPIITHSYEAAGDYTIILVVMDSEGKWDAESKFISVQSSFGYPTASFTYSPTEPLVNETVVFDASESSDTDGTIVSYVWDFGDDTPVENHTDPTVTHVYTSAGTYNVTLTVTDDDGLSNSFSDEVKVRVPGAPVASFTYSPVAPSVNELVLFNASLSEPNGGTIVSYHWSFGDGVNGTGEIATHVYESFGYYLVTLTVVDSEGYEDSVWKTVTVYIHDVAIVSVSPWVSETYTGQVVNVTVVARNEGTAIESFNVTLYHDNVPIGTKAVASLAPSIEATLTFSWNTSAVISDVLLKAEASIVRGEIDTVDNIYLDGTIKISAKSVDFWSSSIPYFISSLLLIGFITSAGLMWKHRRNKKVKPSRTPSEVHVAKSLSQEDEEKKYRDYLVLLLDYQKLQEKYREGKISEEKYLKLKAEYEAKLQEMEQQ
ncbi:MAG: PKD domain-containing protein [Candidatus Bathyarchaeia archaeon]